MTNLVTFIDVVIDKYHNGTNIEFGIAEINYIEYFQNSLSQSEIIDVNNWVVSKGYQSFL